jgi:citrate synthase
MSSPIEMSSPTGAETHPDFTTNICLEQPLAGNPYVAGRRFIAGYDAADLWRSCTYADVLLLLLSGELPTLVERRLLETFLIGLLNPGPRHPAVRAAMLAGVSKTAPEHLLPIGLLTGSGSQGGALEVMAAHEFMHANVQRDPQEVATELLEQQVSAPGFGTSFGEPDPICQQLAADLIEQMPDHPVLQWCRVVSGALQARRQGWLTPGIAAAVGLTLGLGARETLGLYQLAIAPGVMAHGMEQTHKPISSSPFLRDEQYDCV